MASSARDGEVDFQDDATISGSDESRGLGISELSQLGISSRAYTLVRIEREELLHVDRIVE